VFEVVSTYPPSTEGSYSTDDEDCLAKSLLARMNRSYAMKKTHRGKKPNPAIVKTSEEEGDETKVKGQNRGAGRFGTRRRDH
jgi:hypothetical protein